jgi:hypothetical protein
MMTGETRRLYPTFSYAVLRIGKTETRRRWEEQAQSRLGAAAFELKETVLMLTDWAACDVDQDELLRLIERHESVGRGDPRWGAFVRAARALWDLMDGSRSKTEHGEQVLRWLLIDSCHTSWYDTPGLHELAHDECERCLSPVDQPWAHDPSCAVCRKRFSDVVWEDDGADGGAEEPLMKSA